MAQHLEMRFQYWGPNGIEWTKWFIPIFADTNDTIQYKCSRYTLHNEYRYVED